MGYVVSSEVINRIENNFSYHSPREDQPERYVAIRNHAKDLAMMLAQFCPPSRELSLALTKLEEVVMWANAAIARNEPAPNDVVKGG